MIDQKRSEVRETRHTRWLPFERRIRKPSAALAEHKVDRGRTQGLRPSPCCHLSPRKVDDTAQRTPRTIVKCVQQLVVPWHRGNRFSGTLSIGTIPRCGSARVTPAQAPVPSWLTGRPDPCPA